ncbi:MAG: MBL fold metallo-hydrolase [Rhodopirellula sp.]|nr:MBL fold metallo-hydrolase [Rhodopirellula sp.]
MVFLGTGTSHGVPTIGCTCDTCTSRNPRNHRTRCSVVLGLPGGNLLVDSSPELRIQLIRERIGRIHSVLYTHGHADHLFGLDDLRIFPSYLGHELPVFCESAVEATIRRSFAYAFDPETQKYPAGGLPKLAFHPVELGPLDILGARLATFRLWHGRCEVLGFRIGDVAYCTDTKRIPAESESMLKGLDVLILDCLRPEPHPTHMSVEEAVAAARRLAPRRTFFTHISHRLEHEATNAMLPPGMELAYDGLTLSLGLLCDGMRPSAGPREASGFT